MNTQEKASQPKKVVRTRIPAKIREKILDEFNHLCAICGRARPQVHHIDTNPSNNEELNLVPLCPNHHLIDAHSPTKSIPPEKLRLFREHKDPAILLPQFDPIYNRMLFLLSEKSNELDGHGIRTKALDLLEFISYFNMGEYYVNRLKPYLIWNPPESKPNPNSHQQQANWLLEIIREMRERPFSEAAFLERFEKDKSNAIKLIVEMLRYQNWTRVKPFSE